jgi:hypothetical protein
MLATAANRSRAFNEQAISRQRVQKLSRDRKVEHRWHAELQSWVAT